MTPDRNGNKAEAQSAQGINRIVFNGLQPEKRLARFWWIILLPGLLAAAILISLLPREMLIEQSRLAEQKDIQRSINLMRYAVRAEINGLDSLAADWATWDETYQFMKDHDPTFLKRNINWKALSNKSQIDLIYFRDNNGRYIWGGQSPRSSSLSGGSMASHLDPELVATFDRLIGPSSNGIILTRKAEPMVVSAHAIIPSSGEGLPRGTLIMGRRLGQDVVSRWANQTQLDIQLNYPGGPSFSVPQREVLQEIGETPILRGTPDDQRVYILMRDLSGQKWLASIKWPGSTWQQARKIANNAFIVFFSIIALGTIIIIVAFLSYMAQVNKNRRKLARELAIRTSELEASETRYQQMIEDMEDAVYIYDMDENLLHYNIQAYTRLGYSAEEMAVLEPPSIIAPEWQDNSRAQTALIAEGTNLVYESYHVRKDGTVFPVEVSSQIIEYNGKPCVLSIVRDISRRKEAEAAREASERLYRVIFENSPVGIIYIDKEKRIIRVNQSMNVVTDVQYFRDRYGQQFTLDIIDQELMDLLEMAIAGQEGHFEGEYQPPPGGPLLNLRILFRPVNGDDLPTDVICMVEDITIRKRDEAQLRQLSTIIEKSPVSVVITDSEGLVQYVNQTFIRVTGFELDEVVGERLNILNADYRDELIYQDLLKAMELGEVWQGEFRTLTKLGDLVWERAVIAQVKDTEGRLTNIVVIKTEITREKLMEEADSFINSLVFSRELETDLIKQALEKLLYLINSPMGTASIHNEIGVHEELVAFSPPGGPLGESDMPAQGHMFFSDREPWSECTRAGKISTINDFSIYAGDLPPEHRMIKRALIVPVLTALGEVTALVVAANKENDYTALDTEIMAYFVNNIWKMLLMRRTELALQESQKQARVIFETVQAGIILIDAEDHRIIDANPAALYMFGGGLEEIKGQMCNRMLCPAQEGACPVLDLDQPIDRSERTLIRKDGTELPILKDVTRLRLGSKNYLLESFVDLTERKAMEEQLTMAKEAAETAYRAKTMFLASMSHEIRTPLNAILGYAQLMKRDAGLLPDQEHRLNIIEGSGIHLLRIINDILEMARLEAGRSTLHETICDFDRMLTDIENMFRLRVAEKGITLSLESNGLMAPVMAFDEGKVRQVLVNLIGNAVKFTERGGIMLQVTQAPVLPAISDLILEDGDEFLNIIEVEDTGKGIPEEKHELIFGVFEQAHHDKNSEGGTGLGLAISRSYAELLGGHLELVKSQVNKGSLFRFTFKGRSAQADAVFEKTGAKTVKSVAADGKEWKVLVVDDRETNRELLTQLLGRIGFEVRDAADGLAGVKEFGAWHPDLVLMDLMMPVMDGYEAITRIRQSDAGDTAAIIAISASVMEESEAEARKAGADAFIRKPFREHDLLDLIQLLTGVGFNYAEESVNEVREEMTDHYAAGQVFTPELLERLKEAVEKGDMREIKELINNISIIDSILAKKMFKMADNYNYQGLMKILGKL
ncbi:MAG: PAS domain S-box protein [Deltaproteobacteria bacterium]